MPPSLYTCRHHIEQKAGDFAMKDRLSSFFSNHSLMTQVMTVNGIIIAALSLLALAVVYYFIDNYNSMLNSQLSTILEVSSDSLQKTVNEIEEVSMDFMADENMQKMIKTFSNSDTYSYEDFVAANELRKSILNLVNDQTGAKFAVLLDNDYDVIVSAMGLNPAWTNEMSQEVKKNMSDGLRYKWIAPNGALTDLIAVRQIVDLSNPELSSEGLLIIGIDIEMLVKRAYNTLREYPLNSLIMADEDVLYSDFDNNDTARQFMTLITDEGVSDTETKLNGKKYCRTYKELETPGWKYAIYVPRDEVFGWLDIMIDICIAIFIAIVILVFFLSYITTKRMVSPLRRLSAQMKEVENGVFKGVELSEVNDKNEIYSLALDFNVMVKYIDNLIHENYLKKILLQESELKLLQSQINPHFLYNTLESINWMAKAGRTKEISVMVKALSNLFRNTVNNKESVITLREELELLGNYISIQKIRFEERLEILIDVDERFYEYKIPKFVLQPLVENSIKYALERYSTVCKINIYSESCDCGMKLYVKDNGPGIEEGRLKQIRENKPIESRSGIALKNIRRRMEITFHRDDVMEIFSDDNKGTTIILTIPER